MLSDTLSDFYEDVFAKGYKPEMLEALEADIARYAAPPFEYTAEAIDAVRAAVEEFRKGESSGPEFLGRLYTLRVELDLGRI